MDTGLITAAELVSLAIPVSLFAFSALFQAPNVGVVIRNDDASNGAQ